MAHILVLEPYRYTLSISRALKASGYAVILGVPSDISADHSTISKSNSIDSVWEHPSITKNKEAFKSFLLQKLEANPDILAIYPCGENSLEALLSFSTNEVITSRSGKVKIISAQQEVIHSCLDKPTSIEIAKSCDIPTPTSLLVKSIDDINSFVAIHKLPIALKPADSEQLPDNKKCLFIDKQEQLDTFVWPEGLSSLLIQKKITGARHNCMFVAEEGKIVRFFESEVLRTTEADNTGYSILGCSVPIVEQHFKWCEAFTKKTRYNGIGCMQFLYDKSKKDSTFLEINPRTDATIELAQYCGLSLIESAVKIAFKQTVEPLFEYSTNQNFHWFFGDLTSLTNGKKISSISSTQCLKRLISALYYLISADCHATWSIKDPKPTLSLFSRRFLNKGLKLLRLK